MDANSCTNEGQPGAPLTGSSAPIVQVSHWQARALQAEAELATLKARLAASQLRTPGTVEVPEEPTQEMLQAYLDTIKRHENSPRSHGDWRHTHISKCKKRWKAMIAARPLSTPEAKPSAGPPPTDRATGSAMGMGPLAITKTVENLRTPGTVEVCERCEQKLDHISKAGCLGSSFQERGCPITRPQG